MATRSSVTICADQTGSEVTQAKCTTQRKRHQLRGGFECVFVKDPSEHPEHGVQTECSICLCVLREPYLLDCCGYSFCKSCIEPIKAEKKPCPLCSVHFTTCIADKRLQRTLNDLQVYCAHKDKGCEWVGRLANLEQHLNASPLHESERLSGCQVTSIECKHCGNSCFRRDLVDHETSVCSQRPYSCEYCQDFKSTFEDVTSNHWSVCPDRPVPCPNGCGSSPELKLLDDHLKECPLEMVECAFSYAGCSETLPRKNMPEHIMQNLAIHMSLQATNHQQEQKKLHCQVSELQELYRKCRAELNQRIDELETQLNDSIVQIDDLKKENQLLLNKVQQECKVQVATVSLEINKAQDQTLKGHLGTLRGEIKTAQAEIKQEIAKQMNSGIAGIHDHVGLVPFNISMPGFKEKKLSYEQWHSSSFYTHPRGYKMCIGVYANGYGAGENSHVSVFVYMMKGEYDDCLKWPFRGDITIQLLSKDQDKKHHEKVIDVTDRSDFGSRVLKGEQPSDCGWGFPDFIRHKHLTLYYLKDDYLQLCVKEVIIKSV